ncbi:MAG: co-chaperone GroES [Planctomycetaceae bacterium]|jgi:chaperonin GroES|nr:co-chaperone GroES [Planctomycetaceae bacterium]
MPPAKKDAISFRPLHDKILVRRDTAEEKTAAGLYLPEKAKETPKTGVVEAVGTGALNHDTGELVPLTVKRGDRVLFTSYAGTEIKLEGAEFLVMSEDEILAVIA